MKLVTKLGLVIFASIVCISLIGGSIRVRHELALIDAEARGELQTVATSLRPIFVHTWKEESHAQALSLLEHAGYAADGSRKIVVEWVPLERLQSQHVLWPEERARLAAGEMVERRVKGEVDQLSLWLPGGPELPPGVFVLTRALPEEEANIWFSVWTIVGANLLLIGLLEAIVLIAGRVLVGRPLALLAAQARRVAAGQLDERLPIDSGDELAEVAQEMNAMAAALKQSQARVAAEHRATLAAVEELRHADRLATVGKLAAGIAHELGTPLTVVAHHAKQIERQTVSGAEAAKGASVITRQVEKITGIVRQLLAFARHGSGQRQRGDVTQLAKQTLELLNPMAEKRGVTLRFEGPPVALLAEFEPNQLEQALTNLVVNGLQAMKPGGTLTVAVQREHVQPPKASGLSPGDYLSISVADQGVGIAPEALGKVFDPFYTTKAVGEGTGLGLSVAYGIAEEHGGWIDVASTVGFGSRFALHIPPAA